MMHGMRRVLVGDWIDLRETLAIDAKCKEMPRVQWDVMQGRDSRHKQGRDKTLPSKDESEARSMTSDDRCSADAKRQKSKRDCERLETTQSPAAAACQDTPPSQIPHTTP